MKNLLLAFTLIMSVFAFAQPSGPKITYSAVGYLKSTPTHSSTDTITNAVTKYQYGIVNGANVHVTVQSTFTKISGTAAATVKLQGSVLGIDWNDIGSSYTVTDVASQTASFIVTPSTYQYYRLSIVPTGTQSVKVESPVLVRQY